MKLSHAALTTLTAIAELRWPIGVGSGALLGGMVGMICIALAWRQSSGDELWHPRREPGWPDADVFQRLRRNSACARFWLLYLGYRSFKLFNDYFLVFVVRMLQLHTFLLKVNNKFFRVHIFSDDGMPPNGKSSAAPEEKP
jgi:hypothetical protein